VVGSFDRPGEPDDPNPSDRRGKSAGDGASDRPEGSGSVDRPRNSRETEADAAERLGLSTLTRGDYYDSQRAAADAQEAAIRRRDAESRDKDAEAPTEGESTESPPDRLPVPIDQPERRLEEPRDYWTEVPRFFAMWHHIKDAWPYVRRSEQGEKSIEPEQKTEAAESIEKVSEGEPPISANVRQIQAENANGGWLEGFAFRLKGPDRLMEKVTDRLSAESDRAPNEVVREIPDAIRYTFCFEQEHYTEGYWDVKGRLESCGYEMYHCKNWWENPEYKGVNSRWVTPDGQRFEVQFHTRESFHAKHEVTHEAYERARSSLTGRAELAEIEKFQTEVSSWIPVPDSVGGIPDYKKKGF
jgi:hypothetical protein